MTETIRSPSVTDIALQELLKEQFQRIEAVCSAYDAGDRREAFKLGKPLRAIFHPSAGTPSLLGRMGTPYLSMLSTCGAYPPAQTHWPAPGFTSIRSSSIPTLFECVPNLASGKVKKGVSLDSWWNGETVFLHGRHKLRRRDLVLHAAGFGADSGLPAEYPALIEGMGTKAEHLPPNAPNAIVPLHHCHFAALRQIAHEALNSPELVKLAGRVR